MISQKTFEMIELLAKKTLKGELHWERTQEDGVYQVSFPINTITIYSDENTHGGELDYFVNVFNSEGELITRISDEDFIKKHPGSGEKAYEIMSEMYSEARNKSLGLDDEIDNIIGDLQDPLPF